MSFVVSLKLSYFPRALNAAARCPGRTASCRLTSAVLLLSNLIYAGDSSLYGAAMTTSPLCTGTHRARGGRGRGGSCGCAFASWLFHCARPHGALLPDGPYMAAERASVCGSVCVRERRGRRRSRRKEEEEEELKLPTRYRKITRLNSSHSH